MHSFRGMNSILTINGKTSLDDVDNFPVVGDGNSLGCFQGTSNIFIINHPAGNSNHAMTVDGCHV